jgi:hypothetical protein
MKRDGTSDLTLSILVGYALSNAFLSSEKKTNEIL